MRSPHWQCRREFGTICLVLVVVVVYLSLASTPATATATATATTSHGLTTGSDRRSNLNRLIVSTDAVLTMHGHVHSDDGGDGGDGGGDGGDGGGDGRDGGRGGYGGGGDGGGDGGDGRDGGIGGDGGYPHPDKSHAAITRQLRSVQKALRVMLAETRERREDQDTALTDTAAGDGQAMTVRRSSKDTDTDETDDTTQSHAHVHRDSRHAVSAGSRQRSPDEVQSRVLDILEGIGFERRYNVDNSKNKGKGIYRKTHTQYYEKSCRQEETSSHMITAEHLAEFHHFQYGGTWSKGRHQFEFLVERGLQPSHTFLEIGCGALRAGTHYMRYLHTSKYHCIEPDELSLRAGIQYEIPVNGLLDTNPKFISNTAFDFRSLAPDVRFDMITAYAVLIHLSDTLKVKCLSSVAERANMGSTFIISHQKPFEDDRMKQLGWSLANTYEGHKSYFTGVKSNFFEYKRIN